MKVLVLLNAAAGTLAASRTKDEAQQILQTFAALGVDAEVIAVESERLGEAAREAIGSDADVVVVGGGDGTINTVAGELVGSGKPMGILPLGTMNHLAKELNIPMDLPGAVAAVARGSLRPFHVGEVNGQIFLSFSAIGLYSEVIKHRDAQRRAVGRSKWPAMVIAFVKVFRRFPLFRVRLTIDHRDLRRLTPLVFVALSEYQRRMFNVEDIACAGREALSVYVAKPHKRFGMIWLIVRSLLGVADPAGDLEVICTPEVSIRTHRRHVRVAMDGEVIDLASPLRYRLRRDALQIVVPPENEPPVQGPP